MVYGTPESQDADEGIQINAFHRVPKVFIQLTDYIMARPRLKLAVEFALVLIMVGFVLGTVFMP